LNRELMMKKTLTLALTSLFVMGGAQARVIYGEDHRKEVSEATPFQQKLAASAATMISIHQMSKDPQKPGVVQLNQKTLTDWLTSQGEENSQKSKFLFNKDAQSAAKAGISFCSGEKFVDQPNPGMCSGFLIA